MHNARLPGARTSSRSLADLKRRDRCWFILARGATPVGRTHGWGQARSVLGRAPGVVVGWGEGGGGSAAGQAGSRRRNCGGSPSMAMNSIFLGFTICMSLSK